MAATLLNYTMPAGADRTGSASLLATVCKQDQAKLALRADSFAALEMRP